MLRSLTPLHVGKAMSENPGYLKLRKIRAAQNIARTVRFLLYYLPSLIHVVSRLRAVCELAHLALCTKEALLKSTGLKIQQS